MTKTDQEPRTEAGKRLLEAAAWKPERSPEPGEQSGFFRDQLTAAILAIEDEAALRATPEPPREDKTLALIRRRAERGVTWEPGSVPRHVSEAVADAFHDRRYLLDLLSGPDSEQAAYDAGTADAPGITVRPTPGEPG